MKKTEYSQLMNNAQIGSESTANLIYGRVIAFLNEGGQYFFDDDGNFIRPKIWKIWQWWGVFQWMLDFVRDLIQIIKDEKAV